MDSGEKANTERESQEAKAFIEGHDDKMQISKCTWNSSGSASDTARV